MAKTPPRRVLQVVGRMGHGGVQTSLLELLEHIDRTRYDIGFLVQSDQPGAFDERIRALGGQIIPCHGYRNPLSFARNFARCLDQHGPFDVVHCHVRNHIGLIMRVAAWKKVPVRIAHSRNDQRSMRHAGPHHQIYDRLMRRWVRRHATRRVAVSRAAGDDLFGAGWTAGAGARVIHSGFDFGVFGGTHDRDAIRRSLDLPPDGLIIGHVGRLVEAKNHRFLVQVVAEAARMDEATRGLFVGGGHLRPEIEQEVLRLGIADHVTLAGERDDVPALMRAMDVFVFPSLHEGLPRALIEAQAAGLPCIVSDRITAEADAVPALIRRLPLTASAQQWARAAMVAAENPRLDRAQALPLMMQSDFDIATSVRAMTGLYDGGCQ